jgi:hypothetical protein
LNESREKCLKVLLARFSDVLSYVLEKFEIGGWDCCVVCDGARSDRMVQMLHELGIRDVGEPAMELFSGYSLNLLSRYMEEDFEHPQSCEHLRQGLTDY